MYIEGIRSRRTICWNIHRLRWIGFHFEQQALSEMFTVWIFLFFSIYSKVFSTSTINIHKKQSQSRHNRAVCRSHFSKVRRMHEMLHTFLYGVFCESASVLFIANHFFNFQCSSCSTRALNIFSRSIDHRIGFFLSVFLFCLHRCFTHFFWRLSSWFRCMNAFSCLDRPSRSRYHRHSTHLNFDFALLEIICRWRKNLFRFLFNRHMN